MQAYLGPIRPEQDRVGVTQVQTPPFSTRAELITPPSSHHGTAPTSHPTVTQSTSPLLRGRKSDTLPGIWASQVTSHSPTLDNNRSSPPEPTASGPLRRLRGGAVPPGQGVRSQHVDARHGLLLHVPAPAAPDPPPPWRRGQRGGGPQTVLPNRLWMP
ncbi:hypothetical protein VTK26DRAFT_4356 [Humicola hyalothermophila]